MHLKRFIKHGDASVSYAGNPSHGMSGTSEYISWLGMKNRCMCTNNPAYDRYGGRGIDVCERWSDSFEAFYADMGDRPENTSLERRDNEKGYSPENCYWATRTEQSRNMRSNVNITFNGVTKCVAEWAKTVGLKASTIEARIRDRGWSKVDAITVPLHGRPYNSKRIVL